MRRALSFGRAVGGVVAAAVVLTGVALASSGASERVAKEGGTFRVVTALPDPIDPALSSSRVMEPACSALMNFESFTAHARRALSASEASGRVEGV